MSIEKPPKEMRELFTMNEEDTIKFIRDLEAEGIPIIDWDYKVDTKDVLTMKRIEYSLPHYLKWIFEQIKELKKKVSG